MYCNLKKMYAFTIAWHILYSRKVNRSHDLYLIDGKKSVKKEKNESQTIKTYDTTFAIKMKADLITISPS